MSTAKGTGKNVGEWEIGRRGERQIRDGGPVEGAERENLNLIVKDEIYIQSYFMHLNIKWSPRV